ncbi:D-alanine--(R)-lactate ligase [Paenibacillus flagellatus]|uniref:D-alanine--D-alanine ligase n=1 Tax=Paenibacillus flagellatus TaxID=2211139 RepID=A0A2V5JYH3_9BACL|nr:D-alanine--(R)-lactate ligase [Paenibacillus flagellatus]PYI50324.1 D-alanine--(R)-lactate ligase [Paenibacillus flagellatus]
MNKLKLAVLFGGCSEEHDVSIKSAQEIARNLDPEKFDPLYIGITKDGGWKLCEYPDANWESGTCIPAMLSPDRNVHGLIVLEQGECKIIRLDVVFPVLHGKMGEDGAMQGLLELSGIPYVGCDIQSSVLCMDKSLAYGIVKNAGIATPDFLTFNQGDMPDEEQLVYPVFVKPARSGSSFGVSKVCNRDELPEAIESARQYDAKIVIEQTISGSEVGCAVLGTGNDLFVGQVDQVRLSHGFFRIHQEKNPENGSENATIKVPADLSDQDKKRVQETAKRIYRALGCSGLARVDMFLQEDGQVVLNEVNTMPGCTSYSRYPRMMAAAGLTLADVIERVVALAMEG